MEVPRWDRAFFELKETLFRCLPPFQWAYRSLIYCYVPAQRL